MKPTHEQLENIREFNKYRKDNPNEEIDLIGAKLIGADLSEADLSEADLSEANLIGADLSGACLSGANLSEANLIGADLSGACLSGANLRGAILRGAKLIGADLRGANLKRATLYGANLNEATLNEANLNGANLKRATLIGADLNGANLYGADLRGAKEDEYTKWPNFFICPEEGKFIAWKKGSNNCLIKLFIPKSAKRTSSIVGRKCRASEAKILAIWNKEGINIDMCYGQHQSDFVYQVGKTVIPDSYDPDYKIECSHGIHYFVTKKEALEY